MNFQRLLNTNLGRIFISVLLGLGIATLFRQVCVGDKCITFNGPVISEIDDKIYKYDEKCYKYTATASKCDPMKRIIDVSDPAPLESSPAKTGFV
jgi:hypothetical protein